MNFNFLNFYTKYKCEGDMEVDLADYACFGDVFGHNFRHKIIHNIYTIYIYDDLTDKNNNNCCLLSKEQIIEFIEEGKKYHKFDYTLERKDDYYILKVDLKAIKIYHKFLLSWFRYLYEFPYNVCLYDVFKVKDLYGFKQLSILNIFNVISASLQYEIFGTDIHCIGSFYNIKPLMCNRDINKSIKNHIRVNDIFKESWNFKENNIKKVPITIEINGEKFKYKKGDFWLNEDVFKKRLKIYRHNVKQIKKIEL